MHAEEGAEQKMQIQLDLYLSFFLRGVFFCAAEREKAAKTTFLGLTRIKKRKKCSTYQNYSYLCNRVGRTHLGRLAILSLWESGQFSIAMIISQNAHAIGISSL